jgi:hypothetical protein
LPPLNFHSLGVQQERDRLFPRGHGSPILGRLRLLGFVGFHRVDPVFVFAKRRQVVVLLVLVILFHSSRRGGTGRHRVASRSIAIIPATSSTPTSASFTSRTFLSHARRFGHRVVHIVRFLGLLNVVGGATEIISGGNTRPFGSSATTPATPTPTARTVVAPFSIGGIRRFGGFVPGLFVVRQDLLEAAEIIVRGLGRRLHGSGTTRGTFRHIRTKRISAKVVRRRFRHAATTRPLGPATATVPATPIRPLPTGRGGIRRTSRWRSARICSPRF